MLGHHKIMLNLPLIHIYKYLTFFVRIIQDRKLVFSLKLSSSSLLL